MCANSSRILFGPFFGSLAAQLDVCPNTFFLIYPQMSLCKMLNGSTSKDISCSGHLVMACLLDLPTKMQDVKWQHIFAQCSDLDPRVQSVPWHVLLPPPCICIITPAHLSSRWSIRLMTQGTAHLMTPAPNCLPPEMDASLEKQPITISGSQ